MNLYLHIDMFLEEKAISITKFFKDNRFVFIAILCAGFFSYGIEISNISFSIDEEFQWGNPHLDYAWYVQQRWGMVFFRNVLLPYIEYPFVSIATSIILIAISLVLVTEKNKTDDFSRIIFGSLAISFPSWAHLFEFTYVSPFVSGSFFLISLSYFGIINKRTPLYFICYVVLSTLAVGTYQSVIYAFFSFYLLDALLSSVRGTFVFREQFKTFLYIVAVCIFSVLFYYVINQAIGYKSQYVDSFFVYGKVPLSQIFSNIYAMCILFFSGGLFFGYGSIPFIAIPTVLILCISRQRLWTLLGIIFLFLYVTTFHVFFGQWMPSRTLLYLPTCFALLFYISYITPIRILKLVIFCSSFYIFLFNTAKSSRLFLADIMSYETDKLIASRILDNIYDKLPDFESQKIPVAFVGYIPTKQSNILIRSEVFGGSFWAWDYGNRYRMGSFLASHGVLITPATSSQYEKALMQVQNMPVWPAKDSVCYIDGVIIVNLPGKKYK